MKHIFVINPNAGKEDATQIITNKIAALERDIDHQIYVTQSPGDATHFVRTWCQQHPDTPVRFYACGGDGTLNEVVSGAVGHPHSQVTVHASGSGNDYIKYYGSQDDFQDLNRLIDGTPHPVDVMRVNDRHSINVCNFGFDAMVCKTMNDVRRKPLIGGSNAYTTGILRNVFTHRHSHCRILVDGQPFHDGKMLLCTLSNGRYVGGNYKCAPLSLNDDGLLEISLFLPLPLLRLATLINSYSTGQHIHRKDIDKLMKYRQGRLVEMQSTQPFYLSVDGELLHSSHYQVENLHHAITFVSPKSK